MKSAETKPATNTRSGPSKPFFNGPGEAMQEQDARPAFFNNSKPVQTKLALGQAGDKYEQEADRTADKVVMKMSAPPVQTKCAACEEKERKQQEEEKPEPEQQKIRKKPIFDSNPEPPPAAGGDDPNATKHRKPEGVQRCETCDKEMQVQKSGDAPANKESTVPANIESRLNSSKGGGSPLPAGTRDQMESSFGADFSGVRVHTDGKAAEMNESLHSHAFAHGNDIYFNSGKYDPESKGGQHLLAHELTHTVQQGAAVRKQTAPAVEKKPGQPGEKKPAPLVEQRPEPAVQNQLVPGVQRGLWDDFKSGLSDAADWVGDKASDVGGWVEDRASDVADWVEDRAEDVADWAIEKFHQFVNWVKRKINAAKDWVVDKWNSAKALVTGLANSVKEAFSKLISFFQDPLGTIADALANLDPVAVEQGWLSFLGWVESGWTRFRMGAQGVLDFVQEKWDDINGYVEGFFEWVDGVIHGTVFNHLPGFLQDAAMEALDLFRAAWRLVQGEWKDAWGAISGAVNRFFELGDEFLARLRSFPVAKIVGWLKKFGMVMKKLIEIWHNPHLLIDPLVKWIVDKLKDAPQKFLAEIEKQIAKNKAKRKAANKGKMPKRYALNDQDIALGVVRACIHKWQQMDIGAMLKDMVLSMVWPPATLKAIGEAWDQMKEDVKQVWDRLYHVDSLEDFWTNLMHLADIGVIFWRFLNTVLGLLYIYIAIILIIGGAVLGGIFGVGAGAIPGALAGAEIAGELGEVLLVSFLAGEATNLGLQYLILSTGLNTEPEQETAFNKIADSIIGLVTAGILAILSAIAARIASGIMTAAKALLSKLSELIGDAAEDVKPGEVHPGGPEDPGGTGDKGGPEDKSGQEDKTGDDANKDVDPNSVENGEAPLEKPMENSADGKRKLVMDVENDCEVCVAPCAKIEKKYGSRLDDETRTRIKAIEDSSEPNEAKLAKLKEIEQGLRDKLTHLDKDGKLKPNQKYNMAGEHGYPAESDAKGRLSRVHTDNLKLSEFERVAHEPDTPGKLDGDHAGHLIGDRFGGSPDLDNLVSQTRDVNLSKFKKMENQWAKALKGDPKNGVPPKKVSVEIKVNYEGDGTRPASFDVSYTIEGEEPVEAHLDN